MRNFAFRLWIAAFLLVALMTSCTVEPAKEIDPVVLPQETQVMPTREPTSNLPKPSPTPAGLRILALGDSYTIGEAVPEEDRWPVQLAARLRAEGLRVAPPQIVARTGWTTGDLNAGITMADPTGPFDLVTLLIGVNNQYRGRPADQYRLEFQELLKRAVDFAGGEPSRVIVISIPDWSVTPFAEGADLSRIAAEINAFNAINRDEAEKAGAGYVDVTPVSRMAVTDETLLAWDNLHPSAKMYTAWVDLLLPEVVEALK